MVNLVKWRVIPGFENYAVSEFGEVRNNYTGKILKPTIRSDGRLCVNLCKEGGRKMFYVHKLVHDIFIGDSTGLYIKHKDGDPTNNSINNLITSTNPFGGKGKARMKRERRVKDLNTGDIYESIRECVLAIGGTPQGVWSCLNGYTKTYKGHMLEYVD